MMMPKLWYILGYFLILLSTFVSVSGFYLAMVRDVGYLISTSLAVGIGLMSLYLLGMEGWWPDDED